jgi:hypothetical protein
MKKALIYILILPFFYSCTPEIFKGLDSAGKRRIEKSDLYPFIVDTTFMYNMQIHYKKNDFSGILLIKPAANHSIRMLFTSGFGLTIFDFEFNETEFNVNRCFESLQKKKVLNLFKKDFRALFSYHLPKEMEATVYEKEQMPVGYKIKTLDGKAYYLIQEKQLKKIEMPAIITSLKIDYHDYKNNIPKHILILHQTLKLNMQLELIEQ